MSGAHGTEVRADVRVAPRCPQCSTEPIGVVVRGVYDGVLFWKCPSCLWAFPRTIHEGRRAEIAQSHIDACSLALPERAS